MPDISRKAYATDGEISVYPIAEEDHDNYTELKRQINGEDSLFLNPAVRDIMWQYVMEGTKDEMYSIFSGEQYCGSIELRNIHSDEPELGIELLIEQRNKGIGPRAIRILARKKNHVERISTFAVRILGDNKHSRHMFEKIGAVELHQNIGIEIENETVQKVIDSLKQMSEIRDNHVADDLLSIIDKKIIEYKLPLEKL